MTALEKEVLGLAKTLAPIPDDILEGVKWTGQWQDWDVNCPYCDVMTIGDVCGRFQVYRHYVLEMNNHYETICKEHPEDFPDWVDLMEEQYCCGVEDIDWEEEDDGLHYGAAYAAEIEVYSEFSQHWLDTTTGEVVFLGRPWRENGKITHYVAENDQPLELIRPEGETEVFYNWWFNQYGNLNHFDYKLHDNLRARGIVPLDTRGMDFEYSDSEFNEWYQQRLWHERVMLKDFGMREDGNVDYEKWFKIGGMGLLIRMASEVNNELLNKENYVTAWKIRLRNHYTPEDEDRWYHLIHLLERNSKDIHNAKYVCPANLEADIDRYERKYDKEERARKEKRMAEEEIAHYNQYGKTEEIEYAKTHGKYLKIGLDVGGIHYEVLQDVKAYLEEGIRMHHCVYHSKYYEHTDTLILSATIDGKRLETIELDLLSGKVIQSQGARNIETPLHDKVVSGIEANAKRYTDVYWADAI